MNTNIAQIKTAFPDVPDIDGYYSEQINGWRNVFEGHPPWEKVRVQGLEKKQERKMNMLNTAKVLCDCFSDLTFSEQVEITIDNETYQKYIDKQLNVNGFWKKIPDLLSIAYALGGCCVKVFAENGKPRIDYIHADKFIPAGWNGAGIFDGIFSAVTVSSGKYYTLIERQSVGKAEYKLFKSDTGGSLGSETQLSELYGDLPPTVDYSGTVPMFSYFKPAVSNNAEYDVPLGMSIYANSLDTLKALDVAFDSFSREFILGKKRIIIPASCVRTVTDTETGEPVRYFDANDEAFVALNVEDAEKFKITDNTIELRVEEHVAAINALLNILCFQVGLSAGTLSFDVVQGVKTATEVISQDSKTQRTIKSNKNLLTEMIEGLIHSLIALGVYLGDLTKKNYTVTVSWQDNVVIDDNTLIDNTIKLYSAGLLDLERAIAKANKCDENTAADIAKKVRAENAVGSADFF
ncbi:MAG: phage portal protein [Ruminococcaceae bacterium]|nr:phage portal protein [Oscillospiraceae bacterium]